MGNLFRSEEMTLVQLFLQSEAAYACVSELGELGLMQFKDLNAHVNAFQRKFVNEIRRCEEMERKIRYIEKEIKKDCLSVPDDGENPKAPAPKEMVDLEATFEKIESELREVNTNAEALKRNYLELTELREVLSKTHYFFQSYGAEVPGVVASAQDALVHGEATSSGTTIQLGFLAGVIPREKLAPFERMMWFACRGNVFLRYADIGEPLLDPVSGDPIAKCVFIVFFQGEQLKTKVKKICEGFRAALYPCPEPANERDEMFRGVTTRIEDLKTVLSQTEEHRHRVLMGAKKEMRSWIIKVEKIKSIYHTLNMFNFDMSHNSLIAEGWCPLKAHEDLRRALREGETQSGSTVPTVIHPMETKAKPPTYFKTNRFTSGFQNIVNAYGIASYMEVNPAPYTIITFPFLFAVMFGDAGHGMLMFLFAFWMVVMERKLASQKSDNEIWNTFFHGRYIIMLMGLFSIYTGMIYNDAFSKSFNIFGTKWHPNYTDTEMEYSEMYTLDPRNSYNSGTAYVFGIDPIWQSATNKIAFLNSFKMKTAVILGISQMLFGIIVGIFNHIHFRSTLNMLCEFLPELFFLLLLFGYLVALVYYKWLVFTAAESYCAPSLLIQYINMFMMKYSANQTDIKDPTKICDSQATFYPYQQTVQTVFVLGALLCVPVLLIPKPLILRYQDKKRKQMKGATLAASTDALIDNEIPQDGAVSGTDVTVSINSDGETEIPLSNSQLIANKEHMEEEDEEEFDFGEVFIHQTIHTIEFCLGCISHTASYLRLWALSLAHAQLSEVLWGMVFSLALKIDMPWFGSIIVFFLWIVWANLTLAILLLMEGLSAFLHTLRLHWVEFQSKFYEGAGYSFEPFSFKHILDIDSLDDIK